MMAFFHVFNHSMLVTWGYLAVIREPFDLRAPVSLTKLVVTSAWRKFLQFGEYSTPTPTVGSGLYVVCPYLIVHRSLS